MQVKTYIVSWFRKLFSSGAAPYWLILLLDYLMVVASGILAEVVISTASNTLGNIIPLAVTWAWYSLAYLLAFIAARTYTGLIRFSSFIDLVRIVIANLIGMCIVIAVRLFTPLQPFGGVVVQLEDMIICCVIATVLMWGIRIIGKIFFEIISRDNVPMQKVFIYGVKEGGVALANSLNGRNSKYALAGFVTDDRADCTHDLLGKRIHLNDSKLIPLMVRNNVKVLMVSPLKTDALRDNQGMVDALTKAGIKMQIYSEMDWDGRSDLRYSYMKDVDIEDLLPRNQIDIDIDAVANILTGKSVLITGAAGSIGSELVRQIATFKPAQLVLIDQAETPLHDIRLMMSRLHPTIPCLTLTASICNKRHMEHVFSVYKPEYVLHAAAYKHVPMMEDNPGEAVYNNVLGTRIIADLAVRYGAKKMVMVSTDKAVNPTNVMGCSKRICEMYCQSLDRAIKAGAVEGGTEFVTTRFGNVLGSNGSVIPLFKEQIRNGGPLTVTHPDIIRYFMLIPEACRLVLQACAMGHGGEIFVFDMGSPVRIADLAQRMILLSGATDVKIQFTGLRDGEKLYEELLNNEENTKPSSHPKIKLANVREFGYDNVCAQIDRLVETTQTEYDDMAIVKQMKMLVPEFKSNNSKYEILDVAVNGHHIII